MRLLRRDWTTAPDGRVNSSPEFLRLVAEVERLIKGSAHSLLNGRADQTARLILAQLAHVHGLRPGRLEKAKPRALRAGRIEAP